MNPRRRMHQLTASLILILVACSPLGDTSEPPTPPFPTSDPTLLPIFEVVLTVKPPQGTQEEADLALVLLDEVTGWPHNASILPMTPLADGRWQIRLNPPAGSLLRYRYVRQSPKLVFEADTNGNVIQNRMLHISGSTHVEDVIAAWNGTMYSGETGRIIGRLVDGETGTPLPEMMVNIAGRTVFTDIEGDFRFLGMVPGLHTITAYSADGSYTPAQQGAIVEANSTTPAQMGLFPSNQVQVTFEVTVPEDTLEGTQLRIAGNLRQFGHLFYQFPGGISNAVSLMPTLIEVDPTHYVYITELFSGTHFRYKYTLGDGLINAERDSNGALFTRDVIIPNEDIILRDTVDRWQGADQGPVLFWLDVPSNTPASDIISLQLNPSSRTSPIPMWKVGDHQWFYALFSYPLSEEGIGYRYCRNQQCGIADDSYTAGAEPGWRTFRPSESQIDLRDTVEEWIWLKEEGEPFFVPPLQIEPREGFEVGVEILPLYHPSWESHMDIGLRRISEFGSSAVILTPTWVVDGNNPEPQIGFDPTHSPYMDALKTHISKAHSLDLLVTLRPTLHFRNQNASAWWDGANRDPDWWSVWYEQYRAFILTYAHIASEMRISKLILGGGEIAPSFPSGLLFDGSPSGTPPEAEAHWRDLLSEIRTIFHGKVAFELELEKDLSTPPNFMDAVDEVHIYWHAPLSTSISAGIEELQSTARSIINNEIATSPSLSGKPISLSVEYASFDGTTLGCEQRPELECFYAHSFDLGAQGSAFVPVDLQEQADAIYALIAEAYLQPSIQGFYLRRYHPIVQLNDKSASVYGKPAQAVLELWYPQITGK